MCKPIISVIVPVYKVEPYLHKCVDSILDQTYKNLEVILVDDGSPDNCGAICDAYASQDNRVKVIHKENGGLSSARNAGLDMMNGAYVGFVDSDDWIEPQMYEVLLDLMLHYDAQMALGGVADEVLCDETVRTVKTSDYGHTPFAEDSISAIKRFFQGSWAAWDKLYQAELFKELRFPLGEINEDEAIAVHLLDRSHRVCYTNEVFYHYLRRPESITTVSFHPKKLVWVQHCRDNLAFIREHHPELEQLALARYRGSILWSLTEMALSNDSFEDAVKELINELRENARVFRRVPFAFWQDRIRMHLLLIGPFALYRWFIRKKRGIR